MELKPIDLREEIFQDIHTMRPAWWMHYGILTVFFILAVLLMLAYVVKYPDIIYSEFRLTTNKPSITLPLPAGSQVERLLAEDQSWVAAGSHLMVITNNSRYEDVIRLEQAITGFALERDSILSFFDRFSGQEWQLGNVLENDWNAFFQALLEYYKIEELDVYRSQTAWLRKELGGQFQLRDHYTGLVRTDTEQRLLLDKQLAIDSTLFSEGVISAMNFNSSRQNFLNGCKALQQNQLALKQTQLEIVRLHNAIDKLQKLENDQLLAHRLEMQESLNRLRSALALWKKNYVLTAPVSGQVVFLQQLKEGEFFEGEVLVIIPEDKSFYGELHIPLIGAGKIEKGQKIVLKLNDYPYREYGVLQGKIKQFSRVAGENYYLGSVEIEAHRPSSFGKKIDIKENMRGIGEVITQDRSLLGRLFEKLVYAFNR